MRAARSSVSVKLDFFERHNINTSETRIRRRRADTASLFPPRATSTSTLLDHMKMVTNCAFVGNTGHLTQERLGWLRGLGTLKNNIKPQWIVASSGWSRCDRCLCECQSSASLPRISIGVKEEGLCRYRAVKFSRKCCRTHSLHTLSVVVWALFASAEEPPVNLSTSTGRERASSFPPGQLVGLCKPGTMRGMVKCGEYFTTPCSTKHGAIRWLAGEATPGLRTTH